LQKALKLIVREMKRLASAPVPGAELRRARDYLIGQLDLSLENSENQMMWAGEQWLGYGKIFHPSEVKKRLGEVNSAAIRTAARQLFRPDRFTLALVSPLKSTGGLEKILSA
jgi:predicted Zn-dependent peptidase